jgi:integrase
MPLARPDLFRGRVRVQRKGLAWHWLPIDPDVLEELRHSFRELQPESDDHVFTVEVDVWVNQHTRERRRNDPKTAASEQALWRLTSRICKRANVRKLSPHQLRHGFANRFIRESGREFIALQRLMGHSRPDTTQGYTDDLELYDLADVLADVAEDRNAQASSEPETRRDETPEGLESLSWRRRESNPRPRTHRTECLRA